MVITAKSLLHGHYWPGHYELKLQYLEEERGSEEDVHEAEHEQHGEAGHERASQVQELAVSGEQGGQREADEDERRAEECRRNDAANTWGYIMQC